MALPALGGFGVQLLQSRELPRELNVPVNGGGNTPQVLGILFVVDSTGDGDNVGPSTICDDGTGHCTLRAAIEASNLHAGTDGIRINIPTSDPGYNGTSWTINLGTALPDVTDSVDITGPGADMLTVRRNSSTQFRIFNIATTGTVTFTGLTISNGDAASAAGGGINNANTATITVTSSTISGNSAGRGGGISNNNFGTVNVTNSTITNNSAPSGGGGGIDNQFGGTLTVTSSTISGNSAGQGGGILGQTVNVTNSTISGNSATSVGGGIDVTGGTVTLTSSTISGNSAGQGGGIYNHATANVTNSTLSGNSATSGGGGIFNVSGPANVTNSTITNNSAPGGSGGGIDNQFGGTLTVTNSTISGNSAGQGGGILGQTVNVTNSTISGNSATSAGGGIDVTGGTVTLTSSTISGNSAGQGGGIYINHATANVTNSTLSGNSATNDGGGIFNVGTANVTNSTITNNSARGGGGGGIDNQFGNTFNVKSSIIALNAATGSGPDGFSTFTSGGFNLIGKMDGSTGFTAPTDQTGTVAAPLDPKLDPSGLQNNGGPTQTIALLSSSSAINKGTSNGLTTDQRGVGFLRTIGNGTDIGAFEFGANVPVVSQKTHGTAGSFNINLPFADFFGNIGIECRRNTGADTTGPNAGRDHRVIMTFPVPVTVGGVSVGSIDNMATATFSVSSHVVTVDLHNVSNAQRLGITLTNVSDGTNTNDFPVLMGLLLGDVNATRLVDGNDVSAVQGHARQSANSTNFRLDVNTTGLIDGNDVSLVQSKTRTSLPSPP